MKVVILCGGRGIRSFPFTHYLPKPMIPIGGSPILTHVIRSFIAQGFKEIVLSAGYRTSVLVDYFHNKDFGPGVRIDIVDTGEDADTGDRIMRCRDRLGDRFIATYGDGLCDVPLARLVAYHQAHGAAATMTSIQMPSQYGVITLGEDGSVSRMREKPQIEDHWINVGFMVLNDTVFDHWQGPSLERHVLPGLVARGQVFAYRHHGFFKSVDSYKDVMEFEELMDGGATPWMVPGLVPA